MKFTFKHIVNLILMGVVIFAAVQLVLLLKPFFSAAISEEEASKIAVRYAAESYEEEVSIDKVFLHGGFLSYLVDGHFHDPHQTTFQLLVDDDSGDVRDYTFSKDYATMKMHALSDQHRGELEAMDYRIPDGSHYRTVDSFFIAYSCADSKACRIQELQVAVPEMTPEAEQQAFEELYQWQKNLPERIDSIFVGNGAGEGISRCLRPEADYANRSTQYSYEEFITQGKCVNNGDH